MERLLEAGLGTLLEVRAVNVAAAKRRVQRRIIGRFEPRTGVRSLVLPLLAQ